MGCPDRETMQDFVDGELSDSQVQQVMQHIRSCESCRTELRGILTLYDGLHQVVDADQCPSPSVLRSYAKSTCPQSQADKIKKHIEFCGRCSLYVWSFQASDEELAKWQAREEQAYQEYEAQEPGLSRARVILERLLPGMAGQIDSLRQSVVAFVSDLKDKAVENWQGFDTGTRLVGALGFAESCNPETEAACVIMATTLYVSQAVSEGRLEPRQEDLEAVTRRIAARLGAGPELQNRLVETLPLLVLKSE